MLPTLPFHPRESQTLFGNASAPRGTFLVLKTPTRKPLICDITNATLSVVPFLLVLVLELFVFDLHVHVLC